MRKKVCWILAICWMAVIFAFSARNASLSTKDSTTVGMWIGKFLMPGFSGWEEEKQKDFAEKIDHTVRKTAHATEYAILGVLVAGGLVDGSKKRAYRIFVPWAIGSVYAASDELHQMFVPGRSCQLTDIMLDSFGVLVGVLLAQAVWARRKCA